jgi:hypothetical protein
VKTLKNAYLAQSSSSPPIAAEDPDLEKKRAKWSEQHHRASS